MRLLPPLLALLVLPAGVARSQDAPTPPPTPPAPCSAIEHGEFDFWIGEWTVTQNGQPAGTNSIRRIDTGCALLESWTSAANNFTGHSLNFFDRGDGAWHQVWVDSGGTVLRLTGGLEDGPEIDEGTRIQVMVLRGTSTGASGQEVHNRITWTPQNDGSVRQHWEASEDGETWTTAFDGRYVRTEADAE